MTSPFPRTSCPEENRSARFLLPIRFPVEIDARLQRSPHRLRLSNPCVIPPPGSSLEGPTVFESRLQRQLALPLPRYLRLHLPTQASGKDVCPPWLWSRKPLCSSASG